MNKLKQLRIQWSDNHPRMAHSGKRLSSGVADIYPEVIGTGGQTIPTHRLFTRLPPLQMYHASMQL